MKNPASVLKVVVLGSTGSLGKQTLKLLKKYKRYFEVVGLSANTNTALLKKQAEKFGRKTAPGSPPALSTVLASKDGEKKLLKLIGRGNIIINLLSGVAGIEPSKKALQSGKILLLANKESLVAEGDKIMRLAASANSTAQSHLIPIDSEHNAIYEILKKYCVKNSDHKVGQIKNIFLPCSGGPFLNKTKKQLEKVTPAQALGHPRWKMGRKISLESATLINKGLEIIEAHYLFKIPLEKIKVFLHPQCKIHGIVEFKNSTAAYFGKSDMSQHLENALLRAVNLPTPKRKIRQLTSREFKKITSQKVPQKTLPGINIVLSKFKHRSSQKSLKKFLIKEEKILQQFLENKISFLEIFKQLY